MVIVFATKSWAIIHIKIAQVNPSPSEALKNIRVLRLTKELIIKFS